MASLSELPSFSRTGKNCTNTDIIRDMQSKSERDRRMHSRGRHTPNYQSLSDTPPVLAGYNVDVGKRSRQIVSSPRVAPHSAAQGVAADDDQGLRFERVMRWDEFPAEARGVERRAHADGGGREQRMRPKAAKRVVPSASFRAPDREHDHMSLRSREQGRLAPPPGHYEASLDIVRVKRDKLAYIANKDRPSAPSFQVERLVRAVSKGQPLKGTLTPRSSLRILKDLDKFPPSSPAATRFLRRALSPKKGPAHTQPAPAHSLQATRLPSGASNQYTDSGEGEEPRAAEQAGPDTTAALSLGTAGLWRERSDRSVSPERLRGPDMARMLPRYKPESGTPTLSGYQFPKGQEGADTAYETDTQRLHTPTPDLSRSGKDHIDQLQRLGYIPPGSVASPVYWGYASPIDWKTPPGWVRATKNTGGTGHLAMDTMLPRRPATSHSLDSLRIEMRDHRDGKMWDGCIPDDRNPSFPHTPSILMARSNSVHKPLSDIRTQCKREEPYNVSERLIRRRTQQILPFHRNLERRPLTADAHTGKPIREVNDLIYDTYTPEMSIVRPRSKSPVAMRQAPGREGFGGIVQESGSGGLHGTMYWGEVGWRTEAVADVVRYKRLPDMRVTPGRVPPKTNQYGDSSASQPMSTAALAADQSGWESGILWDPKDSAMGNIPTPNLDTNERARDAERSKKKTLSQDLFYDVNHSLIEKRVPAVVIRKGDFGR